MFVLKFYDGVKQSMGVVDAAECRQNIFFLEVVLGVVVILCCEFHDFFLLGIQGFFLQCPEVVLEHDDVLLDPYGVIHGFVLQNKAVAMRE